MPGYQFIHYDTYGLKVSAKAKGGGKVAGKSQTKSLLSVRDVCAEALREDGAHPHVEAPQPPRMLHGIPLAEVERQCVDIGATAKDASGKRLRKDAAILLAGVASYPVPRAEADPATVAAWERQTVAFLRGRWGDRLQTVLAHDDERFPHLHFYVLAEHAPGQRYSLDGVCNARAAQAAAKASGAKIVDQRAAYVEAMERLQDAYYDAVSIDFGICRHGPRRDRASRIEWQERQRIAEQIAADRALARDVAQQAQRESGEVMAIARGRADQVVQAGQVRAGAIVSEARDQAAEVRAGAEADAARTRQEAARMAEEARGLLADLRSALDAVSGRLRAVGAGLLRAVEREGTAAAALGLPELSAWRQRRERLTTATRQMDDGSPPSPRLG